MPTPDSPRDHSYELEGPRSPFEGRVVGAALAAALDDPSVIETVLSSVAPGDIVDSDARAVLTAISDLIDSDRNPTPSAVAARLERTYAVSDPVEVVRGYISQAASTEALEEMIQSVRGAAAARISRSIGLRLTAAADTSGEDQIALAAAISAAQTALEDLTQTEAEEQWQSMGDATMKFLSEGPTEPLCSTGLIDLDDVLQGGFRPGQLIVVAGRPAMGKSTLAFNFSRAAAIDQGLPSVYVSLEMSARELSLRCLSAEGRIDMKTLQKADVMAGLSHEDQQRLGDIQARIAAAPLDVVDPIDMTWSTVASQVRAARHRHGDGPMLVVLDYLGLISPDGQPDSRQQALQEISRRAKQMAKSMDSVVVLVSQLNRGPETRSDHRPMMSDLRETGALEQDADIILLVHRPDYYNEGERVGEADVIVAKHRNGETGTVPMAFQGHYSQFAAMGHTAPPPPDTDY